jgi:phage terminase small subunit
MNDKQLRFIEEYCVDLNASAAARRAGYAGEANKVGPRLARHPRIRAEVLKRQEALRRRTETSAEKVIEDLKRLAAQAEAREEFTAAIRAVELLGKHLGMFVDRTKISVEYESMTDEQLEQQRAALLLKIGKGGVYEPEGGGDD